MIPYVYIMLLYVILSSLSSIRATISTLVYVPQ
nr:MAG TPA: hypothetical protein [Caudoviricetes sp.]